MKKILLLFFLSALLSSCGNNYTSGGNGITIRMKSGAQNNYHLLSVRDNSLVVVNVKNDSLAGYFSFEEVIPFDSIYKVYRSGKPGVGQYILGGIVGFGAGALVASAISPANSSGVKSLGNGLTGAGIGFVGGVIISTFIPPSNKQLHPSIPQDKEFLRQISSYPNGEPELLKLVH